MWIIILLEILFSKGNISVDKIDHTAGNILVAWFLKDIR